MTVSQQKAVWSDVARSGHAETARTCVSARIDATAAEPAVPDYLKQTYTWAYLHPSALLAFDRPLVVSAILWGNYGRLLRATLEELRPGQSVLQPACVYGDFSQRVAAFLGHEGRLDVTDAAPIQVENCREKLAAFPHATARLRDATEPCPDVYDAVCCFFLLHELPEDYKQRVVEALLGAVRPGGKAVFVDYHKPHPLHPLKAVMSVVFDTLEPFAKGLWQREIADYADDSAQFSWSKQTFFGGLYQKVVARRRPSESKHAGADDTPAVRFVGPGRAARRP